MRGHDTYREQDILFANVAGVVERVNKLISVMLEEGDRISTDVQNIFNDGSLSLHTRSLKYGKRGARAGEEWNGMWDTSLIYEASRKYGVTELLIQDCLKDVAILTMQVET